MAVVLDADKVAISFEIGDISQGNDVKMEEIDTYNIQDAVLVDLMDNVIQNNIEIQPNTPPEIVNTEVNVLAFRSVAR